MQQYIEYLNKPYNGTIHHPFSMLVAGPSQSGKTTFIIDLIKNREHLIDTNFKNIYWFYGVETKNTKLWKNVYENEINFINGIPENIEDLMDENQENLFIFDDLMNESVKLPIIADIFTKHSHHKNTSVILILQDFFHAGGRHRITLTRNANCLTLFCNPLDYSTISTIASRIMPKKTEIFLSMYKNACAKFRYLFIDGNQTTSPELRFRTDLFNNHQKVFVLKK